MHVDVRGCVCAWMCWGVCGWVCQCALAICLTVLSWPAVCLQVLVDISWAFSKEHVAHLLHKLQRMPPCDFTLDTIELTKKLASTSHHGPAIGRSGMVRVYSVDCYCLSVTEPTRMQRVWLCPIVYCMCCVSHDLYFCFSE